MTRLLALGLLAALAACGGPEPPPPPTVVELTIEAGHGANPDATGEARPIVVHVYRLRGVGAFEGTDYFRLESDPSGALGPDLIGADALTLAPGTTQRWARELEPEVGHIGIAAGFRDIAAADWRDHAPVTREATTRLHAQIGAAHVTVREVR
jgi:type VI secretion system protein VasD